MSKTTMVWALRVLRVTLVALWVATLAACTAQETRNTDDDFGFEGTCVNCHQGLSSGHVHAGFKLRCADCHGGNDQTVVPADAATKPEIFRDPLLVASAHVRVQPGLAKFFWANGVDDDGDSKIDEGPTFIDLGGGNQKLTDPGEIFEPGLHGEGAGEFIDVELQRDLNYLRFMNPGDLRVATIGCGSQNRASIDGGGGGCHQNTVNTVRRSLMVNQAAVINGAYYGNQSWRSAFQMGRDTPARALDPRAGAFGYALDYAGVDACIDVKATQDGAGGRGQPVFDVACLTARAAQQDPKIAANAINNKGLPGFQMAQGTLSPSAEVPAAATVTNTGAGFTRYPWGGQPLLDPTAALSNLDPVPDDELLPGVPDPIDVTLRTFRAYYPLNYPGSTNNFNFTFGTSILPEAARFKTANAYGRGHSSGCTGCHAVYNYDGARNPSKVRGDDGTISDVVDPTTKHREWTAAQDTANVAGDQRLVGRAVSQQERDDTGRKDQQKTYSANHQMTTKIDSDQCGLCHGFVTRINLAYQGMAEDEQRNQFARRAPITFKTPAGTNVRILDSWIREDNISGTPTIITPDGIAIIDAAKQRDAALAAKGLVAGAGGCGASTFSEDCNNNGELDRALTLSRRNEDGDVIATETVDEDSNRNGKLDLIDHAPREKSVDGRQPSYVYGGRNGSTRQMDVHFERGMHCIDCHFIQDVHGDGHLYNTNWDQIEIECEDCHGAKEKSTLRTSGPNGGNDMTAPKDADGVPYMQRVGTSIMQRSRVNPGVFWKIPQTPEAATVDGREAHGEQHVPAVRQGSTFAGAAGSSALVSAKLECQSCHSSWIHNCMGCHADLNLGDNIRKTVAADGTITKTAGENETWLSNTQSPAHINFQLLGFMRSPFVLATAASADGGRLAPFRSSMIVQVNVTDGSGHTLVDNASFTTFQAVDGNSGRAQVATSSAAMNQTMPHTTRPVEAKGCETCHTLVDRTGKVRNEHVLAQTYGLGAGEYPFMGDWAIVAGTAGLELYDYKQERELAANRAGASNRFPGFIINPTDRVTAKVEPIFDGAGGLGAAAVATDVALIRNFNTTPANAGVSEVPTFRDVAVVSIDAAGVGSLLVTDVSGRGHPSSARLSVGNAGRNFRLALPGPGKAVAHLSPDVSDPFVYVAVGTAGVAVVKLLDAPSAVGPAAQLLTTLALPSGRDALEVVLAGDVLYVGTQQGTVEVLDLSKPNAPVHSKSVTVGAPVTGLAVSGFMLYGATANGLMVLSLSDPKNPTVPTGASNAIGLAGIAARELSVYGSHVFMAAGSSGVFDVDVAVPAAPVNKGNIAAVLAPGQPINANDVTVSRLPGQTWVMVADAIGDLWGLKLDGKQTIRERCYPDPRSKNCLLDLDFLDPTINGRDPSFDPNTNTFDLTDPSSASFVRMTRTVVTAGRRLARPAMWEQLGTLTGRRLRDSFMPGSGVLSLSVMQRMRAVVICEDPNVAGFAQSGLGAMGYADAGFLGSGVCAPFTGTPAMAKMRACNSAAPSSMLTSTSVFAAPLACRAGS